MKVKAIVDEDFNNYNLPSMLIGFPKCSFKCERDCGIACCQNSTLVNSQDIDVNKNEVVQRYLDNPITAAIVCGGLEPLDSWGELYALIQEIRKHTDDDIVIYTGYYEYEIQDFIDKLSQYKNIVIKFGRFIPNQKNHFDPVLGVNLASDNQYAERIS